MAVAKIEAEDDLYRLNDDDFYPEVQPWRRDRSKNDWNLRGVTWGGTFPQDLDLLNKKEKKKKIKPILVSKKK